MLGKGMKAMMNCRSDIEDDEGGSQGFWSDNEDAAYSERQKKGSQVKAIKKEGSIRTVNRSKQRHDIITSYNTATRVSLPHRLL